MADEPAAVESAPTEEAATEEPVDEYPPPPKRVCIYNFRTVNFLILLNTPSFKNDEFEARN